MAASFNTYNKLNCFNKVESVISALLNFELDVGLHAAFLGITMLTLTLRIEHNLMEFDLGTTACSLDGLDLLLECHHGCKDYENNDTWAHDWSNKTLDEVRK